MKESNVEKHQKMTNEFIELANKFKDEGTDVQVVSAALMYASGVYTTYVHAGNEGYLQASGVTKVINAYEKYLHQIQAMKASQAAAAQQQPQAEDSQDS